MEKRTAGSCMYLYKAIANKKWDIAKDLIESGAALDNQDENGNCQINNGA